MNIHHLATLCWTMLSRHLCSNCINGLLFWKWNSELVFCSVKKNDGYEERKKKKLLTALWIIDFTRARAVLNF
jgi:hypothetical protein